MYRKSRNSRVVRGGGVGAKGMVTKGVNWRQSSNQVQTLHECLCCHICYAHLGTPWHRTVTRIFSASFPQDLRPSQMECFCDTCLMFDTFSDRVRRCVLPYIYSFRHIQKKGTVFVVLPKSMENKKGKGEERREKGKGERLES